MPDQLKSSEVNSKTDPSVAKQYDNATDKVKQIQDFFSLADDKKIGILNTYRNGVGTCSQTQCPIHTHPFKPLSTTTPLTLCRSCWSFHGHCSSRRP